MNRILVTGGSGMIGHALRERLPEALFVTRGECDLEDRSAVQSLVEAYRPTVLIHLAALVAGVKEQMARPYDFFAQNVAINTNVINAAIAGKVDYFIAASSACAYPNEVATYPISESHLHDGPPAPDNFSYGYAKRCMSIQLDAAAQQYGLKSLVLLSCNVYGPHDKFDLQRGQFIPSLIVKVHEAKLRNADHLDLLGTGRSRRQFMYAGDFAEVAVRSLHSQPTGPLNVAPPESPTIDEVATTILETLDCTATRRYLGTFDGVLRRDMDTSKLQTLMPDLTFTPLAEGIRSTYKSFLSCSLEKETV